MRLIPFDLVGCALISSVRKKAEFQSTFQSQANRKSSVPFDFRSERNQWRKFVLLRNLLTKSYNLQLHFSDC